MANRMGRRCIRPTDEELENFGTPDFTIYNAGKFPCNRYTHYMTSSTSVDINLARREMVILGTQYAGEMKKGLFGLMHYLMPKRQILSLHSGCNMGKHGDVALFFGLSGEDVWCRQSPAQTASDVVHIQSSLLCVSIYLSIYPFD
jgi:phosphoenolpyruvate carboxykinase (ATP)